MENARLGTSPKGIKRSRIGSKLGMRTSPTKSAIGDGRGSEATETMEEMEKISIAGSKIGHVQSLR